MPKAKSIGSIWEVPYTFEDDPSKYKKRPIIVVGIDKSRNRIIGVKCTTKDKPKEKYAYILIDGSMMHEMNLVLCNHIISVKNVNRNFKYIGSISNEDIVNILNLYNNARFAGDLVEVNREWVEPEEVDEYELLTESAEDTNPTLKDIVESVKSSTAELFNDHMAVSATNVVVGSMDGNMLVQYSDNPNSFSGEKDGFGIVDSKKNTKMRVKDDNKKTEIVDKEPFLQDKFYNVYRHKKDRVTWVDAANLYEEITGKVMLSKDQIKYDDDFEEFDYGRLDKAATMHAIATMESKLSNEIPFPVTDILELNVAQIKLKEFRENTSIMHDSNGFFALDMKTGMRTKSYDSIYEIDSESFKRTLETHDTVNIRIGEINSSGMYKVLDAEYSSQDKLNSDWNEYNNLPTDEKRQSDDLSLEIYGKTNTERYKELRAKYLDNEILLKDLPLKEFVTFDQIQLSDLDRAKDYGIDLRNKKTECEYIWNWSLNSGIYVVLPCDSEESLEEMWANVQSMDISLIRISDSKLMEVFGCNNETMYNFLKSIFTNKGFDDFHYYPLIESSGVDLLPILPNVLPFYIPSEIEVFKNNQTFTKLSGTIKQEADKWLVKYKKLCETGEFNRQDLLDWVSFIRGTSFKLSKDPDNDTLKQTLIEFGWSPYMEFNNLNRYKARLRCEDLLEKSIIRKTLYEKGIGYEFNKYGDLRIKNIFNSKDYQTQYMESHRLLMEYDKVKNINAMKYELARMYSISQNIDKELITTKRNPEHKKLINTRARVLNDFSKYIKVILKYDKSFNFANYYQRSEFSDDSFVISAPTLKYSGKYVKDIIKASL